MTAVFFLLISLLCRIIWPRILPKTSWLCPVLAIALPFCAGGFHTGTAAALCLVLTAALLEQIHRNGHFRFCGNWESIALMAVLAAYCVTPLWAADKGMAVFAIPRYFPPVLFALLLMQSAEDLSGHILGFIPLSGCLMTLLSVLILFVPNFRDSVIVNGRLAGFFQYPNSFAAFLLAGLILQCFREQKWSNLACFVLMSGIVLSGSKTVFVLMLVFIAAILLIQRKWKLLRLVAGLFCALGAGFLVDSLGLLSQADRFTQVSATSGTFLVRLLYYRDAMPAILTHPFGIGYMGYPAIEGTIQTGRYSVTYIHNGFLQLLLEIGWIPAVLLAFVLLRSLISRKTALSRRLLLLAVLAHCMLDFDLQFAAFWILMLCCLDLTDGKARSLPNKKVPAVLAAGLLAVSLWLGCGDWLYRLGNVEGCLALTPFHTEALTFRLTECDDPEQVDEIADQILRLNPTHSMANSAKANAAFSRGDILSMIRYKENAIRSAPYTIAEYCDYFQKLYTAMGLYLQANDQSSAVYCRDKLLHIPEMMDAVSRKTHPLAYLTGDDPTLVLPAEYTSLLEALKAT